MDDRDAKTDETDGAPPAEPVRRRLDPGTPVGRRVLLGMLGLGGAGIALGSAIESVLGGAISSLGNSLGALGALVPGAQQFRFYTVTGGFPSIPDTQYRLDVVGMVDRQLTLTVDDLEKMPATNQVHTFQCVTGWTVPDVHWTGVHLATLLAAAGVREGATALRFFSYDGVYTESLTLDQAQLSDVIVAYRMLGGPITSEHGGPVRLYVAPMYGYKSIKWLRAIQVTNQVVPGFWEDEGYPVDGWIGGVPQ
jgi:DMSO/TMAO reductase YedYZ molybdopterin-dependent catalytic subunit